MIMVRGCSHSRGETYREIQTIATWDFIYLVGFWFSLCLFVCLFVSRGIATKEWHERKCENAATAVSECDWWHVKVEASGQAEHLSPRGGKTNYMWVFL